MTAPLQIATNSHELLALQRALNFFHAVLENPTCSSNRTGSNLLEARSDDLLTYARWRFPAV